MSTALAMVVVALAALGAGESVTPDTDAAGASAFVAASYSASGTHQCRTADGGTHRCVVTGTFFSTCIDADSSLRTQDCCPTSQLCERDAGGLEINCRRGGTSSGFTLNYCIPGR